MRGATGGKASQFTIEQSFQSTRPMRGATSACSFKNDIHHVSIHAPHAGRDVL